MKNIVAISALTAALVAPNAFAQEETFAVHNDSGYTMVVNFYDIEEFGRVIIEDPAPVSIEIGPKQIKNFSYTPEQSYIVLGKAFVKAGHKTIEISKTFTDGTNGYLCSLDPSTVYAGEVRTAESAKLSFDYHNSEYYSFDCSNAHVWKAN